MVSPETQPPLPVSIPLPSLSHAATSAAVAQQTPDLPTGRAPITAKEQFTPGSSAAPAEVQATDAVTAEHDNENECFDAEASVIRLHLPHYAVAGFVNTSLRFLVPIELWGVEENMRCCFKHIDRFVRLRRFEYFSLKEATHSLQSRNFPPESKPTPILPAESLDVTEKRKEQSKSCRSNAESRGKREHPNRLALRQRMLDDWIYWIFTQLVMSLSAITTTPSFRMNAVILKGLAVLAMPIVFLLSFFLCACDCH